MSDILIKGMEMPKDCGHCLLCEQDTIYGALVYRCLVTDNYLDDGYEHQIMKDCPLVPAPTPHGRCIDADALIKSLSLDEDDAENGASLLMAIFIEVLKAAPTIIPAEEGET